MNKQFAAAWDEVAVLVEQRGATLVRDGHRFFVEWSVPGRADAGASEVVCSVWAEENVPCFGVRVGDVSGRFWSLESGLRVLDSLTA